MTRTVIASLLLAAAVATVACGSSTPTSPSTAATSTASTELFNGTLSPGTSSFYSFSVATAGDVSVTLVSTSASRVGLAGSAMLSIGVGTPSGFGCTITSTVEATPGLSAQLNAPVSPAGIFCVAAAENGAVSGDITFVIRIVHT